MRRGHSLEPEINGTVLTIRCSCGAAFRGLAHPEFREVVERHAYDHLQSPGPAGLWVPRTVV